MFDKHKKGNNHIQTGKDAPETLFPGLLYTYAKLGSSWEYVHIFINILGQ